MSDCPLGCWENGKGEIRGYIGLGITVKGEPGLGDLSLASVCFNLKETHHFQEKVLQAAEKEMTDSSQCLNECFGLNRAEYRKSMRHELSQDIVWANQQEQIIISIYLIDA